MRSFRAALASGALMLLTACGLPGSQAPDPRAVLTGAAHELGGLKTVTADLKFGPGIVLDNFGLASATSKLRLPGDSDTSLKVKQQDFLIDVRIVTTGGKTYLKLPFGQFAELTAEQAAALPDLGRLLDAKRGLPAVLAEGKSPALDGTENVGGHDSDRVTTTYTAEQIGGVLGAVKPAGDIRARIWVAKDDHLIRKVTLAGPLLEAGTSTSVEIVLRDFNAPVDIAKPAT